MKWGGVERGGMFRILHLESWLISERWSRAEKWNATVKSSGGNGT